jgi:hypothetical protein
VSLAQATSVADAVLYEGYLLYPYRATSAKNQLRWQFGVLGPEHAGDWRPSACCGYPPATRILRSPSTCVSCSCSSAPWSRPGRPNRTPTSQPKH